MDAMQAASLAGGPFYFKRSGPFVAAVNGNIPADEAQSLLASVNYDADVTWNQPTKLKPDEDRGGFIFCFGAPVCHRHSGCADFWFCLWRAQDSATRLFPNKVFNRPESVEFIRLDLK